MWRTRKQCENVLKTAFFVCVCLVRTAHNFVLQKGGRITAAASLLIQSLWNVVYLLGLPRRRCVLMQVSGAGGTTCVTEPCTHTRTLENVEENQLPPLFFFPRVIHVTQHFLVIILGTAVRKFVSVSLHNVIFRDKPDVFFFATSDFRF